MYFPKYAQSTLALQTVLHDAGVNYPITDSKWVASILLIPKNIGTTLEEIQNDCNAPHFHM
jgi:hypothetical protein